MEPNRIALRRWDILNDAISTVLATTLQSKEAHLSLKNAFPSYSFTDEMGTTDSILTSLTKMATDIALARVDILMSHNNAKRALDTIDAQFIRTVIPQNDSMEVETPVSSIPEVALTDVTISCKKKELEKLNGILQARVKVASDLQEKMNTYVQQVGSMHGEITTFSQNAEQVFHMTNE